MWLLTRLQPHLAQPAPSADTSVPGWLANRWRLLRDSVSVARIPQLAPQAHLLLVLELEQGQEQELELGTKTMTMTMTMTTIAR